MVRSSRPEVFCKKSVLRNFTKFPGKYLCQSLIFNKVAGLRLEILAQVFSCEFCEISKNTFLHRTPLVAASGWLLLTLHQAQLSCRLDGIPAYSLIAVKECKMIGIFHK